MPPKEKQTIPKALREQVWLRRFGKVYTAKCSTTWCRNKLTVFDFQCGHDIPESKGGPTTIQNLVPICARCNLSMGSQYTFCEWCALSSSTSWWQCCCFCCFYAPVEPNAPAPR